jgi:hypothetical protein
MQLLSRSILRVPSVPAEAYRTPQRLNHAGPAGGWSLRLAAAIAEAIATRIEIVMAAHRNAHEAAAAYEDLSRLCNAELGRRRLARASITWHVFKILTQSK